MKCKFNELKEYIESKWLEGMSWENYGPKGWHIDHIIPAGILDLTLTDNATGSANYAAKGAHRLKISLTLKRLDLGSSADSNFVELKKSHPCMS